MLERTTLTPARLPDTSHHLNPRLTEFVSDEVPFAHRDQLAHLRLAEVEHGADGCLRIRGEALSVRGDGPAVVGEELVFHADCTLPGARTFDLPSLQHHAARLSGVEEVEVRFHRGARVPIGDVTLVRG